MGRMGEFSGWEGGGGGGGWWGVSGGGGGIEGDFVIQVRNYSFRQLHTVQILIHLKRSLFAPSLPSVPFQPKRESEM